MLKELSSSNRNKKQHSLAALCSLLCANLSYFRLSPQVFLCTETLGDVKKAENVVCSNYTLS